MSSCGTGCNTQQIKSLGGGGGKAVAASAANAENLAVAQMESASLHFSRYTVRFLMRAGFEGLSSWWQQGIGSGHSTWAFTVHVRHPMCVRCKE
jgi:hypothetical protein